MRENGATSGAGVLATYAYDNLGRRTSLTRGNGVVTTYTWDSASRLAGLGLDLSGSSNDQTWTFTYNAANQVLTSAGTNGAYDPTGFANGTTNGTANGLNQLTTVGGATLTWNSQGALSSDGTASYGYDALGRLTSAGGVALAWDPTGRLYQTTGAATTRLAYDGADLVGEYDAGGGMLRRWVHGPSVDEPLVWYEGAGTGDRRWLVADRLGSIAAVSNGSGGATAINTYDEYGRPGAGNLGRFQYTGQTFLAEIGLYNYKARFYSPGLGRFLQTDPIGYAGGMNLYAYVGGDPANGFDPSGLFNPYENPMRPDDPFARRDPFGRVLPCSSPGDSGCRGLNWNSESTEVEPLVVVGKRGGGGGGVSWGEAMGTHTDTGSSLNDLLGRIYGPEGENYEGWELAQVVDDARKKMCLPAIAAGCVATGTLVPAFPVV